MMLQLPVNLSEVADPARVGGPGKPVSTGEFPVEWGDLLGLLLAAEPGETMPALAPVPAEGAPAPLPGTPEALARTLFAALQAGKILPPGGEALPLPSQLTAQLPGQSGVLPGGPAPAGAADPADATTDAMTRMLDLLRTLQGAVDPSAGGDDMPLLQRAELKMLESTEAGRLLQAATPAAATATASAAAGGLGAASTPTAAAPTATPPSLPINTAPGQPEWGEAVGQRVLWMVANKSQVAELRLNPPELGPLEVKVRSDDDGLRLTFAAGNGAVREALEAAAPRLREMFQAEGLRLENLDIGQRQADGERAGEPGTAGGSDESLADEAEAEAAAPAARVTSVGLVDLFV
ncbi:flagellar hook-length control protein FliK [Thioalkalivibrio sp. XN8]|uniref:flagellar hook-length control protein FliK n=1 Tax=Thioalkalivibrio sp. XN8 TaxID=2712863 RepID=UPI0013EA96D4|nr:flagellar hook-length control protein FliK [Thioalkalivibrio sp. XN8]NGP52527.1 flagellar hook-length control protein FliK [Thioalkalivibrio sp. XN8]